ncbi:Neurochondrin [Dillenia turbinata]|uniref:Neurochondrin n=1 Tax=Dillenia turbinata TaxID=194707 RepID=A0AAN8VCP9_9MAGN
MEQSPELENCLKLLKGERDEQRLAGLLLVTKFCNKDDQASILKVYNAVGVRFLDRLLRTGMGKASVGGKGDDNRDAYLKLSVTVLAAFCRVPDIASSKDMVLKIPLFLEILSNKPDPSVIEECFEFVFLVSSASDDGVTTLYESGGLKVVASHISTFPDGSYLMEVSMRLMQLILTKLSPDNVNAQYPLETSMMVVSIARQFAVLHNALKFEALHLLSHILSAENTARLCDSLRLMSNDMWSTYTRVGVVAILQNRVAPAEKLHALIVSESMIGILGEGWLIGPMNLPGIKETVPADRCLLLVLESSRVEAAVLLNELAYLKYEASKSSSFSAEDICSKQRNLAIAFSLVEKIIKLISTIGEDKGSIASESTFTKLLTGLNETIGVVLEYLQDAKEHGQRKGDDLLASVRIIGSYLAEAPLACKEKVWELLEYMLLVEGEGEPRPFYSVCFLLPLMCQLTMNNDGCKVFVSSGGFNAVVACLMELIRSNDLKVGDSSCIFLACDTIMNVLLKRDQMWLPLDESNFVPLLRALACWTDGINDQSIIMMASSICSLVFDSTSEEALLRHPDFEDSTLNSLSRLIARSLATFGQDFPEPIKEEADLHQIIIAGYSCWADRFPHVKQAVEQ